MDQATAPNTDTPGPHPGRARRWLARIGVAGFLFFTIKGLLWLLVPALIAAGVVKIG